MLNKIEIALFLISFVVISAFTKSGPGSANDAARADTIESLVERGTMAIDDSTWSATIDKVYYHGHFYAAKTILPSLTSVIPYFFINKIFGLELKDGLAYYLTTLISVGLICSFISVFFYRIAVFLNVNKFDAAIFSLVVPFATPFLAYSVVLSNHSTAATFVLGGIYFIMKNKLKPDNKNLMYAGFLFGLAGTFDLFASVAVVAFTIYTVIKEKNRAVYFIAAAVLPYLVYAALLYCTFNEILPEYFHFPKNDEFYHYPGSYWNNPQGIDALKEPKEIYAFNVLFGETGLFSITPLLLLSVIMLVTYIKQKERFWHETLVILVMFILFSALFIAATSTYSGEAFGQRFFVFLIPAISICLPLFEYHKKDTVTTILFIILVGGSLITATIGALEPWARTIINNI